MAIDKKLQIFDDEGNPVDYDILANDVKFLPDGKDLPTKLAEMEEEIGEGGYTPPQGGIPKTDLASDVQTSLGKADTAYQKPASGIPATDLADGVVPDVSGLATKTELQQGLADKVDKVTGYGLSKNDYTDADKTAVGTIPSKANDNEVVKSISVNGQNPQTPTQGNVNINVQGVKGDDGITPHIGANDNWWVGPETDPNNDTGIKAQGPAGQDGADGQDGTLTLEEGETPTLSIVANLTTDDDLTDNIKVLSAGMGKRLKGLVDDAYHHTGEGQEVNYYFVSKTLSQLGVVTRLGYRYAGEIGLITGNTKRLTLDKVLEVGEDITGEFKVSVPSGYKVSVKTSSALSTNAVEMASLGYTIGNTTNTGGTVQTDGYNPHQVTLFPSNTTTNAKPSTFFTVPSGLTNKELVISFKPRENGGYYRIGVAEFDSSDVLKARGYEAVNASSNWERKITLNANTVKFVIMVVLTNSSAADEAAPASFAADFAQMYFTEQLPQETDTWLAGGIEHSVDASSASYVCLDVALTDDTVAMSASDESVLQTGIEIKVKETSLIPIVENESIRIIGASGSVAKRIFNSKDTSFVQLYNKEAVDAKLALNYRKPTGGEEDSYDNITFLSSDLERGKQRQPGAGITGADQSARFCIGKIYDLQDDTDNLEGIVSMHIPTGYKGGVTQCKVTTPTNSASNYIINDFATGDINITLDENYRYVTFNFARTDNGNITVEDISTFVSGFYMTKFVEATITNTTALQIVDEYGDVVKRICSDGDGDTVVLPTKSYVDALIPSVRPILRVLSWNIGHFAVGSDWRTKITDANYDDKLKQWKKLLNETCANVLLLSEYNDDFGSHTVSGSTVTEDANEVLFSAYFDNISKTTQSAFVCNAILAKTTLSNGNTVGYTQSGQSMNYRVAEISLGGKIVKLVVTHLDWTQNETYATYRAAQIQQLITAFKNEPYVIIGGDFNVDAATEFGPFKTNGFSMLNHDLLGDIYTYPATGANAINTNIGNYPSPYKTLDNIIFKGFRVSNCSVVDEGTMSDHCGLLAQLEMM